MKKYTFIIVACMVCNIAAAQSFQAYLNYCQFNTPNNEPFVETYLAVVGKSVKYVKNANGKYQGAVDATLIFRQDSVVKDFKKITLLSPEVDDTLKINFTFIDQQRFSLKNGKYDFDILIADHNNLKKSFASTEKMEINLSDTKMELSDIQFVESFQKTTEPTKLSKSGVDLIPYVSDFFPENVSKLKFYCEIYNSEKNLGANEAFLIKTSVKNYETGKIYSDLTKIKKQATAKVAVVLAEVPLEKLPSGNYYLCIELIDKNNNVSASKNVFFQRSNPSFQNEISDIASLVTENTFVDRMLTKDTLIDCLYSLIPIATNQEEKFINNQVKSKDINLMRKTMLHFWEMRSDNPEKAWLVYNLEVQKVNRSYSTRIKKGYTSDRGRIYLRYGPPNSITEEKSDPSAYPYEIWHYYKLKNQSNRKFIFYNPDLATNDYPLLHSDAYGEMYDQSWELKLKKRNNPMQNIDDKGERDRSWGDNARDNFNNPH
ncbi:MAG: GWxTD domain-containing protein [Bacteroidota bacterium]